MSIEIELNRAKCQRYMALLMAFKILDAFVIPSVDPEMLEDYDKLKKRLTEAYSDGITDDDLKGYSFDKDNSDAELLDDLNNINSNTAEGKLLVAAISKITTESQTDKTPNEVIGQLNELSDFMFNVNLASSDE